jgi:hypothetical protein
MNTSDDESDQGSIEIPEEVDCLPSTQEDDTQSKTDRRHITELFEQLVSLFDHYGFDDVEIPLKTGHSGASFSD